MQLYVLPTKKSSLLSVLFFLIFVAFISLTGCAELYPNGVSSVQAQELPTESDEPILRKRARIRLELASGYLERGQALVALDELKKASAIDPSYGEVHHLKALVYMQMNEPKLAELSFNRAKSISPSDPDLMQNIGWFMCQQSKFAEFENYFSQALSSPKYTQQAKTHRTMGLCQAKAGRWDDAGESFLKSYVIDPLNPETIFNLAQIELKKNNLILAQKYIRELNNSDLANAESFWLGIKVEHRLNHLDVVNQLVTQLRKRFPRAKEINNYERGAFDE